MDELYRYMFDLHHVPNIKDGRRLIKGFDVATGLVIALRMNVHRNIKSVDLSKVTTARELLAKENLLMRKYTRVPAGALLKIVGGRAVDHYRYRG